MVDGNNSYYMTHVVNQDSIKCDNALFNEDPRKGKTKFCSYKVIEGNGTGGPLSGSWVAVTSNGGNASDIYISETLTTGTSNTDQYATSEEWGVSVTVGIEVEGMSIIGGANASMEVSTSYARSQSFSNAVTREVSQSTNARCTLPAGANFMQMWRF